MSAKKQRKLRGPSRPIDPRYAPGAPQRRGPDTFGLALLGISTAVVLLIIVYVAAIQGNTGTTATTTNPSTNQQAQTPSVSALEAKTLFEEGAATIIDVRPSGQYDAERIKGATNVPYDQAQTRLAEFPRGGNVILYCQWPADEESVGTAQMLIANGYTNVKVLKGGIDAWKGAGGPIEQ